MKKRILVSGASIAGPTLAYWLAKYGFDVTVVERTPSLRLGGQNVDVKGPALSIIKKMGLESEVRAATTTEVGIQYVTTRNEVIAQFPKDSSLSMTQDLEILRGDLVEILHNHTKSDVAYRFGNFIVGLEDTAAEMIVTFSSGKKEAFDLVVSAEGIGSSTRKLRFSTEEIHFKYLGVYTAYLTIDKADTDTRWARWCNAPDGIVFILRPDNYGQTRAFITFVSPEMGYENLPLNDQKNVIIHKIRNAGWEADRLIREIQSTTDLYFDRVSQVKASTWSKGRLCLTGDAAWCATPLIGKGVDLSMTGAYILAGELSRTEDHRAAFEKYESRMRDYVEKSQKLPPGAPGILYPTSKFGLAILNGVIAIVGSRPVKWLAKMLSSKGENTHKSEIELPDYQQNLNSN